MLFILNRDKKRSLNLEECSCLNLQIFISSVVKFQFKSVREFSLGAIKMKFKI